MNPRRFAAFFALLFAAHVGVMLYMSPASVVLGREPMISLEFSTHSEQCKRAVEAWQASGRTWLWDPHLLAGQPSGALPGCRSSPTGYQQGVAPTATSDARTSRQRNSGRRTLSPGTIPATRKASARAWRPRLK